MAKKKPEVKSLSLSSHPLVYEVNARVLVNELSTELGKKVTLATIPDRVIDEWASYGFEAIWLMGVWTTGKLGVEIARTQPSLQEEYKRILPDVSEKDVVGSPYSLKSHTVSPLLGRSTDLSSLRKRLARNGMGLILDFVSNHTGRDHAWVTKYPEYYIQGIDGEERDLADSYFRVKTSKGDRVLAFGRDPYYPGWTDTAQLNIQHPVTRRAQIREMLKIAGMCDGVRCDMAMLVLKDVFEKTWGERSKPTDVEPASGEFWNEAIETVREDYPSFMFIAEAYWNLEWQLQQLGFAYTYDKTLYDRLLREGASSVYDHLKAEMDYQKHSLRFLENHDERRAADSLPSEAWNSAAATIAATVPGMILFHDGQLEGRKIKIPVQLARRPNEPVNLQLQLFFRKLLPCVSAPAFQKGECRLLHGKAAWHDNPTWRNFLAFWWHERSAGTRFVVVNYAPQNSQCYIEMNLDGVDGSRIEFHDLLGDATYVRERETLLSKGMYFDLSPYGLHIFEVIPAKMPFY
jgi:hypothetical protein